MKLIHTSDWHLGRTTYGEPRALDHDAVIAEIIDLARQVRPDLICHSGDLFDHGRPTTDDMARAADALIELAAIAPVVVVCGNHDSPKLFGVFNRFLGAHGRLHFIDRVRPPNDGGIARFPTAAGHTIRLAAVPFLHANHVIDAFGDPARWGAEYAARVRGVESALGNALMDGLDPRTEIAVFTAHLYVGGAGFCGSERGAHISDTYATDLDALPPVSYAAFGHIHKPQELPGKRVTGRYAGSPIQLDFGEIHDQKSVVIVEAQPGVPTRVETVNLSAGRRLRTFRGTFDDLAATAPTIGDDLCLITVDTPTHMPTLNEQVRALLPHATLLQVTPVSADRHVDIVTSDQVSVDVEPDLTEMFAEFLADRGTRHAPAKAVMEAFSTVFAATTADHEPVFPEESLLAAAAPPGGHKEATQ